MFVSIVVSTTAEQFWLFDFDLRQQGRVKAMVSPRGAWKVLMFSRVSGKMDKVKDAV